MSLARRPQDQEKFMARLPGGARERLKEIAKRNRRSMNAELGMAVEAWLEHAQAAQTKRATRLT